MKPISCAYAYPVTLVPEEQPGGFVVTLPDFPEAITQGDSEEEALREAEDCLEEAVANRIMMNIALPEPSAPAPGQQVVCLPAPTAVKAAFYSAIRELNLSKVQLAAVLGVDEKEVRRLLDPYHPSKLNRIDELLRRLGKRLVVGFQSAVDSAASRSPAQESVLPSSAGKQWDASRPKAGRMYVVSRRQNERRRVNEGETQVAS
jgi:antitoxin HicB